MKRLLLSSALIAGMFSASYAQQLLASFQNVVVSGNTMSFDIYIQAGTGYTSATTVVSGSASMRFDITNVVQTGLSVTAVPVAPFSDVNGLNGVPGAPPAGSAEFGVNFGAPSPDPFLAVTVPVYVCRVTVTAVTPILPGTVMTMRPSAPPPTTTTGGASGFSYTGSTGVITAQNNVSLSLDLKQFAVEKAGSQANLTWSTVVENQSNGFEIERSANGKSFQKIGFVKSQSMNGNSDGTLNYAYADVTPLAGTNYYRLKHISKDGSPAYSEIRKVTFGSITAAVTIAPNPFKDRIEIGGLSVGQEIKFTDMSGKVMMTKTVSSANEVISTSGVVDGIYILTVLEKGKVVNTAKVVKQ